MSVSHPTVENPNKSQSYCSGWVIELKNESSLPLNSTVATAGWHQVAEECCFRTKRREHCVHFDWCKQHKLSLLMKVLLWLYLTGWLSALAGGQAPRSAVKCFMRTWCFRFDVLAIPEGYAFCLPPLQGHSDQISIKCRARGHDRTDVTHFFTPFFCVW